MNKASLPAHKKSVKSKSQNLGKNCLCNFKLDSFLIFEFFFFFANENSDDANKSFIMVVKMFQYLEDLCKSVNQYFLSHQYVTLGKHARLNDPGTVDKRPVQRMQRVNVTEKGKCTHTVLDSTLKLTLKQRHIKAHKTPYSVLTASPCEAQFSSTMTTDDRW